MARNVLFVCNHNAGRRSQMAEAVFERGCGLLDPERVS
jgi:protein-tyrosine-phosphatase